MNASTFSGRSHTLSMRASKSSRASRPAASALAARAAAAGAVTTNPDEVRPATRDETFPIALGAVLFISVAYSFWGGTYPTYFAELFSTPVRYSGMAIGNQLGLVLVGFAPAIGTFLLQPGKYGWMPVALFAGLCIVIASITVLTSRETFNVPLARLGKPEIVPSEASRA